MSTPIRRFFAHAAASFAILSTILFNATAASAITQGTMDNGKHPAVGALLAPGLTTPLCSGTLISPTVYLTAAHCVTGFAYYFGGDVAYVTFADTITDTVTRYRGRLIANPAYYGFVATTNPYDIAVMLLDKPVKGIKPMQLPTAGYLDQLATANNFKDQIFTPVGYGDFRPPTGGAGGHQWPDEYNHTRYATTSTFNSLTKDWLRLSQNPATDNGGTCYGDSGGPNFLGTSNIIAGITITGDVYCMSTNVDLRLDTPMARSFLSQFVKLP